MNLNIDTIQHVARLSKIALTSVEEEKMQEGLSHLLAIIAQMQTIDTDHIQPMAHPHDAVQALRADVVTETDQRDIYQKIAPAVANSLYLVPKVIE